jgi:hypothetical protein
MPAGYAAPSPFRDWRVRRSRRRYRNGTWGPASAPAGHAPGQRDDAALIERPDCRRRRRPAPGRYQRALLSPGDEHLGTDDERSARRGREDQAAPALTRRAEPVVVADIVAAPDEARVAAGSASARSSLLLLSSVSWPRRVARKDDSPPLVSRGLVMPLLLVGLRPPIWRAAMSRRAGRARSGCPRGPRAGSGCRPAP